MLPELPVARPAELGRHRCPVLAAGAQRSQADAEIGAGIAVGHRKDIDPVEQVGPGAQAGIAGGKSLGQPCSLLEKTENFAAVVFAVFLHRHPLDGFDGARQGIGLDLRGQGPSDRLCIDGLALHQGDDAVLAAAGLRQGQDQAVGDTGLLL